MVAIHMKKSLEAAGYEVVGMLTQGEEAMAKALELRPDLILMDIMLEGELDGVETASRIRDKYDVPIIFLTALSDSETINRAKSTGPFGYIMKPFNERELHTNIEMVLHKDAAEKLLKASEARFYSAVRSIDAFLFTLNHKFEITYANPAAEQVLTISFEEAMGKPIEEVLKFLPYRDQMDEEETGRWLRRLVTGNPCKTPLLLANGNEGQLFGQFHLEPTQWATDGSIDGYLLTFQDITAEFRAKELERQIERNNLAVLIEGQEQERQRVARELHDSLGQMLSGIKMHLDSVLMPKENGESATTLKKLLDEAIIETTRISENLVPSRLENLPLRSCILGLCKSMDHGYEGRIDFSVMGPTTELIHTEKVNVYRIVQEAINNAVKYAQASTISVQLSFNEDILDLTIEDDGVGFDLDEMLKDTTRVHRGLQNMIDRARIMNAELSIESNPKFGTLIHLTTRLTPVV